MEEKTALVLFFFPATFSGVVVLVPILHVRACVHQLILLQGEQQKVRRQKLEDSAKLLPPTASLEGGRTARRS